MTLYTAVLIIHGFAALFGLGALVLLALKPASQYQKILTITSICGFIGLTAYLMELMATNLREALLAARFGYIGKSYAMMLFLIFMAKYCDFKMPRWLVHCLLTFSTFILMLVFTCNHHTLYYSSIKFSYEGLFPHLVLGKGVMYFAFMAVTLVTMLAFLTIAVVSLVKQKGQEKRRIALLLLSGLAPAVALALNLTTLLKGFDPTPIGILASCMLVTYNVTRYGLLDTMQLASNSIMDITDKGIVVVSQNNNLVFANNTAKKIFPELEGSKEISREVLDKIFDGVDQRNTSGKQIVINNTIYGITFSVLTENKGKDEQGISGYMAWIVDVTKEYNYTKELERLRHSAEEANNAKTAFLARMSHEIRTPMNGIMGFAELALENDIDEETREYVEYIKSSSVSLLGIINDVLDISKIESGKMEIIDLEYSPKKLFGELAAVMETQAELKNLKFVFNMDEDIPAFVFGDKKRIGEILNNILGNAIKYTKHGSVNFDVGIKATDGDKVILEVHVIDTGVGIKQENINKIFRSFEQFDAVENYHVEGTGLGLSIAKQLTELMGGEISLKSEYGKGSDFCVIIPQRISSGNKNYVSKNYANSDYVQDIKIHTEKIKALVVDDNQINLKVEKGILEQYNMDVDLAMSGHECLDMIKNNQYDIIFMDHMMPGIDGVETMKKIREGTSRAKNVPIILVTANAIVGVRESMIKEGFDGFVSKPIVKGELLQELSRVFATKFSDEKNKISSDENEERNSSSMEKQLADAGLDVETGIKYCGDMAFYQEILEIAVDTAPDKLKTIRESLANEDYKNFTIVVHSVKSNAANIGAMELSEAARELEMAGKREDISYILENTDKMLELYENTMNKISRILNIQKEDENFANKGDISEEELNSYIENIESSMDELNSNAAMELLGELLSCNISNEAQDVLRDAIKKLDNSDIEGARNELATFKSIVF